MQAFTLWHCGNHVKGYPPFKNLNSLMVEGQQVKRLSDLRFFIDVFNSIVKREIGAMVDKDVREAEQREWEAFKMAPDNLNEAMRMFLKYDEKFYLWLNRAGKTNLRRDQLKWSTYVRKLRKIGKKGMPWFRGYSL
eukprot:745760-Hanusia_phi.AAC.1